MSGLFAQLSSTMSALTAASRSIETAGKNLANVNNPDYARQRIVYGSRGEVKTPLGTESLGLEAVAIQQLRDALLDKQVMREDSTLASYQAEQSAYEKAQAALGQSIDQSSSSGSTGGIAEALSNFFSSFQSFAASPTDVSKRQTLVQYAGVLTDSITQADARIAQVQTDLTTQIQNDVSETNTLLSQIAELNKQIGKYEINSAGSAVDLRDERLAKLDALSKKMSIVTEPDPAGSGQIQVFAAGSGGTLVQLIDLTTVTGTIAFSGSTLSVNYPSAGSDTLLPAGGSITGALTARDGAVENLRSGLDALAQQLVDSVNGVYPGDFFVSSGTTADSIMVDSAITAASLRASTGTDAGDNTVALAVANLANTVFSSGAGDAINGTFTSYYTNLVTGLGQTLSTTNDHVKNQTTIDTLVRSQRDAVSGVSMDEEMTDLMKYQRAFQASSRVISIIDDLLDTVVNKLG